MNNKELGLFYSNLCKEELDTLTAKGTEYQPVADDVFSHFRVVGATVGTSTANVCVTHLLKHVLAVCGALRAANQTGRLPSTVETLESRIKDARCYLGILAAMLSQEQRALPEPSTHVPGTEDLPENTPDGTFPRIAEEDGEPHES